MNKLRLSLNAKILSLFIAITLVTNICLVIAISRISTGALTESVNNQFFLYN